MSYGFEATNSGGKVTISHSFPLIKFAGKGTITGSAWNVNSTYGFGVRRITFTTPVIPGGVRPQVFIYNPTAGSSHHVGPMTSVGGGQWSVPVYSNYSSSWTCQAYCFFDSPKSASTDTHGIRIFESDGTSLVYDSGWAKKDILEISGTVSVQASINFAFTIPSGLSKPAFASHFNYTNYFQSWNGSAYAWIIYKLGIRVDSLTSSTLRVLIPYYGFHSSNYGNLEKFDNQWNILPYIDGSLYD